MTRPTRMLALILGAVAIMGAVACTSSEDGEGGDNGGSGTESKGTIATSLTDAFVIDIASATAEAGAIAFEVTNTGQLLHEFMVVRTDLAEDALPIDVVQVDEAQLEIVASTLELPPGQSQLLLTDLEAGHYVLICNIPGHYNAGMHRTFTVK
jgi:uncharacterized cupredoxin-like copper-binding protein